MRRVATVAVIAILLGVLIVTTPVGAENPTFEAYLPENIVEPGEETTLTVELRNAATTGPDSTATNVEATLEASQAPVTVQSDTVPMTSMGSGGLTSQGFTVAVHDDAETGTYNLRLEIDYEYTTAWGAQRTDTDVESVQIRVDDRARFRPTDVTSAAVVGDQGTLDVTLNNTGTDNASDAVVRFSAADQDATMVSGTSTQEPADGTGVYVGDWAAGETATATAALEMTEDAVPRTYPVTVQVAFRDEDGIERTSRERRVGVPVAPAQTFAVQSTESTLHVGEDGAVTGEVVNEGPRPVENAVLMLDDGGDSQIVPDLDEGIGTSPNIHPRETQYALGDLDVGESTSVDLQLGASQDTTAGPRQMEANVRYRYGDDTPQSTSNPVDIDFEVGQSRDVFAVDPTGTTIEAGATQAVELEVTNTLSQPVRDVEAKLFPNSPLEGDDDEAFVPSLDAGESTTLQFEISATDGASPQTYPLRMDFRYEDDDGDLVLSDMYRIPVTVTEPGGGIVTGSSLLVIALVLTIGVGVVWRFRTDLQGRIDEFRGGSDSTGDVGEGDTEE